MKVKEAAARIKAAEINSETGEGEFTALVSVFNAKDSYGDVIVPGAFAKSLADWEASGDPIPVIWAHDWGDPFSHIGYVTKAEETPDGLVVTGRLDLENEKAAQVHRLLKGRRVKQFSFAYDIEDAAESESEEYGVYYELRRLKLHEVGPCLIGVNQETDLLAAKARNVAASAKAGRVLSSKNFDQVVAARDALNSVIESAMPDEGKAETTAPDVPGADEVSVPSPASADAEDPAEGKANDGAAARRAAALTRIINL